MKLCLNDNALRTVNLSNNDYKYYHIMMMGTAAKRSS